MIKFTFNLFFGKFGLNKFLNQAWDTASGQATRLEAMEQQTTGEKSVNDSRYVKKLPNVFVFESNKSGPHDLELKSYHLSPSVSLEHL